LNNKDSITTIAVDANKFKTTGFSKKTPVISKKLSKNNLLSTNNVVCQPEVVTL
jgi:hypothetical protein